MKSKKAFFYRINAGDLLAEVVSMTEKERGKWALSFALALQKGDKEHSQYVSTLIAEATDYIDKKKDAAHKRWDAPHMQNDAPHMQNDASSSSSSSSSTVTKTEQKKESKSSRFTPPTIEEVKAYFSERKAFDESEEFFSYHESKGWKVGNAKMANWRAAVVTWIRNDFKGQQKAYFDRNKPEGELARMVREEKEAMAERRRKLNQGAYQ